MVEQIGRLIIDIIKSILALIKRRRLVIPHPEESPDYSRTIENTDIDQVRQSWFAEWAVPDQYRKFWMGISLYVSFQYAPYPAATISETKEMWILPAWANPGVIAHEFAHISYSLLSDREKGSFEGAYKQALTSDVLLKLLDRRNSYMNTNIIEAHAEVYRYLGEEMPEPLKKFYPNMF